MILCLASSVLGYMCRWSGCNVISVAFDPRGCDDATSLSLLCEVVHHSFEIDVLHEHITADTNKALYFFQNMLVSTSSQCMFCSF